MGRAVEVFDNGDAPYLRWCAQHDAGLVGNIGRAKGSINFVVHTPKCSHITRCGKGQSEDCFTTRDWIKICAETSAEFSRWFDRYRPSALAHLRICKSCRPRFERTAR